MTEGFVAGDRVGVRDPALAQLRVIMEQATGVESPPNHHGTVESVEDGLIYINFDEDGIEGAGNCAPYPAEDVYPLARQRQEPENAVGGE